MSVTNLLEVTALTGRVEELKDVLRSVLVDTRAFEGCEAVEVLQDVDDPDTLVLVQRWTTREAHEAYVTWRRSTGGVPAAAALEARRSQRWMAASDV